MEGAATKIDALIKQGNDFTYETFAQLEPEKRWAESYLPAWVSWLTRVSGAIDSLFGTNSAPSQMLAQGDAIDVLGNGRQKFDQAKSFYMGALETARDVLEEDIFGELAGASAKGPLSKSNRVFVVHGHDNAAKTDLEIILREIGLEPVVLHRQADQGKTLIEKFEHYSDVGFAFILLTPDEIAYLIDEDRKDDSIRLKEHRPRPNTIFEFGFFVGRLGRDRTCCIYKSPVIIPSDLDGLIYKRFEKSVEEVAYAIQKELKAAGYSLS